MRLLFAMWLFLLSVPPTAAQIASVKIQTPRLFGYYIGDIISSDVLITIGEGFALETSSLPAPGPLNYWLNLRTVTVNEEGAGEGTKHYRLILAYQTFYDPLEPHWLKVPGFQLSFGNSSQTATLEVPDWSFLSSPIREVSPKESKGATHIQPDVLPHERDLVRAWRWFTIASLSALIAYLIFAFGRAWVPFRRTPERPFTEAARRLKSGTPKVAGEEAYRQALILLHLAFNRANHRAVLADDLPDFLSLHPRFRTVESDISQFIAASRRTFFGRDCAGAMRDFSIEAVVRLSQRLSATERGLK